MDDTGPVEVDGPSTRRRGPNKLTSQSKMAIRDARDFFQKATIYNPKWRWRTFMAIQDGTINPTLERAALEIARFFPKGGKVDDLTEAMRGMTILLRKSLSEDPLAEPKKVGESSTVIEHPAQEPPVPAALPPRSSIVPPARPKRTQGKATLKPGEEELT